jgi:hypothetical protein
MGQLRGEAPFQVTGNATNQEWSTGSGNLPLQSPLACVRFRSCIFQPARISAHQPGADS